MKAINFFRLPILIIVLMHFSDTVSAQFAGGNGSSSNPYKIESIDDWIELSESVQNGTTYAGVYFQMQNDIDFSGFYSFVPVGGWANMFTVDGSKSFAGHFDGRGFSVLNLEPSTYENYVGLFGKVTGGSIKNLKVINGYFLGNMYIGLLIGYNAGATVSDCYAETINNVSCNDTHLGGLIGYNAGSVSRCHFKGKGEIMGYTYLGGLIGYNTGTVSDCSSEGIVIGIAQTAQIGGLIGYNAGAVSNCNSKAEVRQDYNPATTATYYAHIGGLIGYNQAAITRCSSEATVITKGLANRTGGLIGTNNGASVTESFSTATVKSVLTTAGTFYTGGLIGQNSGVISKSYFGGKIITDAPTPTVAGLIASNTGAVSECYTTVNAAITATYSSGTGNGGKLGGLIGDNSTPSVVEKCYSNTKITATTEKLTIGGLVANNLSIIRDSYVPDIDITSRGSQSTIGGLVGYNSTSSLLEKCYSKASILGTNTSINLFTIGGLIGSNVGTIKNCCFQGIIEGTGGDYFNLGGLVGENAGSLTIENSYSTGTIKGSGGTGMRLGGLIGYSGNPDAKISNCYSAPTIQTQKNASNFMGIIMGMNSSIFTDCYYLNVAGRFPFGNGGPTTGFTVKELTDLKSQDMVDILNGKPLSKSSKSSENPSLWGMDNDNINAGFPILTFQTQSTSPVILPITLRYFNATCKNHNHLAFNWGTATESNNAYFTIEISEDGYYFETLVQVPGAGNSNIAIDYSQLIAHPIHNASMIYVRLKQTDYNGTETSFLPIVVNSCGGGKHSDIEFKIYPNPAKNTLNIESGSVEILGTELYDLAGRQIKHLPINNNYTNIDVEHLQPGIYLLKIKTSNKEFFEKFKKD